ncbi:MAG: Ig-like domain-containing protein [Deltaproteobacteria bacterium]
MIRICRLLPGLLLLAVLAGCGENSKPTRSIDFLPLQSLEITSQNPQVAVGTTNRFTAIGHYGDPSTFQFTRDITDQVSWSSSNPSVLSLSSDPALAGFATAVTAGTATVEVDSNGIIANLPFTVSNATISSLSIPSPTSTTLYAGGTLQLQAMGTFSDGSSQDLTEAATWSSSDTDLATVGNAVPGAGLVKAVAQGSVNITAVFGSQSATQPLDVSEAVLESIAVTTEGSSASLAVGTTMQLTATGTYSDGNTKDLTSEVTWTTDDTTVAAIDQNAGTTGLLSALSAGSVTVTASLQGVTSTDFTITVNSATLSSLSVSPTNPSVLVGQTQQLTATGTFSDGSSQDVTRDVTWSSNDTSIATVSGGTGMEGTAKGIATGSATITASSGEIPTTGGVTVSAATDLTVQ